jgi:hypothetical protein
VEERLRARAEEQRAIIRGVYIINRESSVIEGMTLENNYDAVYGDSLKLVPIVRANPDTVRLVEGENGGWFTRRYLAMAVPRNDIDFRLLVEYTLQELWRDGTIPGLQENLMPPDGGFAMEIWPGSSMYLGYTLSAS